MSSRFNTAQPSFVFISLVVPFQHSTFCFCQKRCQAVSTQPNQVLFSFLSSYRFNTVLLFFFHRQNTIITANIQNVSLCLFKKKIKTKTHKQLTQKPYTNTLTGHFGTKRNKYLTNTQFTIPNP